MLRRQLGTRSNPTGRDRRWPARVRACVCARLYARVCVCTRVCACTCVRCSTGLGFSPVLQREPAGEVAPPHLPYSALAGGRATWAVQPVKGDVTIVLITATPGCPSKTLHTATSGSPVRTDGPSFVSPHHFCSPGQAQAGKPTRRPRAALPPFQRLASIESLPHQPAQASTPGAPQAGEVCLPAGRTGDQRPGSPRAACHHGAARGRPFHGARPSCSEQERTDWPLPWEVTLFPSPHVAPALSSGPGPCRALSSSGAYGGG